MAPSVRGFQLLLNNQQQNKNTGSLFKQASVVIRSFVTTENAGNIVLFERLSGLVCPEVSCL